MVSQVYEVSEQRPIVYAQWLLYADNKIAVSVSALRVVWASVPYIQRDTLAIKRTAQYAFI